MGKISQKVSLRILALTGVMFALTNCVTTQNSGPEIPTAELPKPVIGLSYIYENNNQETIIAENKGIYTWRSTNGTLHERNANPFIPYQGWKTATRKALGWIDGSPTVLWPLQAGNSGNFDLNRKTLNLDGSDDKLYQQTWYCDVAQTQDIKFNTSKTKAFVTQCKRYYKGSWVETHKTYYAPEYQAPLIEETTSKYAPKKINKIKRIEFDTSVLTQKERNSIVKAVQNTLDGTRPINTWKAQSLPVNATIKILDGNASTNNNCKSYVGIFSIQERTLYNYRKACKQNDGTWIAS
jgi:hypothetical protein